MKIKEDIKPISYLKSRSAELLRQINKTHRPVIITQNGEPRAIVQDPETYEEMRNSLGLMKLLAQGERDVQKGHTVTQRALFRKMDEKLRRKRVRDQA